MFSARRCFAQITMSSSIWYTAAFEAFSDLSSEAGLRPARSSVFSHARCMFQDLKVNFKIFNIYTQILKS